MKINPFSPNQLLQSLTDLTDDHANYRSRLAELQPPAVPYLIFVMSDITRIEAEINNEAQPQPTSTTAFTGLLQTPAPKSLVSFEKLRALARIRGYVASFQASTLEYDLLLTTTTPNGREQLLNCFFGREI